MSLIQLTPLLGPDRVLTKEECAEAVEALLDPVTRDEDKAAFLSAQMEHGLKAAELVGFAEAVLPRAQKTTFTKKWGGADVMDCCGTGGGGLNILNISTGMVFILAAGGVPVVKHGNRGVTKRSGSADVLEALGLKIEQSPEQLEDSMGELGWGFIYAPNYHPSFKAVSAVRKHLGERGQKTIFNFLGPLINPTRPNAQLVGVFEHKLMELYYSSLQKLGCQNPCVVLGQDQQGRSLGEVSFFKNFFMPDCFQIPLGQEASVEELNVRDARESAHRLEQIFAGTETGLGREMLIENAAVAFWVQGRTQSYREGQELAKEIIATKAAARLLGRSREWSRKQK